MKGIGKLARRTHFKLSIEQPRLRIKRKNSILEQTSIPQDPQGEVIYEPMIDLRENLMDHLLVSRFPVWQADERLKFKRDPVTRSLTLLNSLDSFLKNGCTMLDRTYSCGTIHRESDDGASIVLKIHQVGDIRAF